MVKFKDWFVSLFIGPEPQVFGDRVCVQCCHHLLRRRIGDIYPTHVCIANAHKAITNPVTGTIDWVNTELCFEKNKYGTCRDWFDNNAIEQDVEETTDGIQVQSDGGADVDTTFCCATSDSKSKGEDNAEDGCSRPETEHSDLGEEDTHSR